MHSCESDENKLMSGPKLPFVLLWLLHQLQMLGTANILFFPVYWKFQSEVLVNLQRDENNNFFYENQIISFGQTKSYPKQGLDNSAPSLLDLTMIHFSNLIELILIMLTVLTLGDPKCSLTTTKMFFFYHKESTLLSMKFIQAIIPTWKYYVQEIFRV